MTVGDVIAWLEEFPPETKVVDGSVTVQFESLDVQLRQEPRRRPKKKRTRKKT